MAKKKSATKNITRAAKAIAKSAKSLVNPLYRTPAEKARSKKKAKDLGINFEDLDRSVTPKRRSRSFEETKSTPRSKPRTPRTYKKNYTLQELTGSQKRSLTQQILGLEKNSENIDKLIDGKTSFFGFTIANENDNISSSRRLFVDIESLTKYLSEYHKLLEFSRKRGNGEKYVNNVNIFTFKTSKNYTDEPAPFVYQKKREKEKQTFFKQEKEARSGVLKMTKSKSFNDATLKIQKTYKENEALKKELAAAKRREKKQETRLAALEKAIADLMKPKRRSKK